MKRNGIKKRTETTRRSHFSSKKQAKGANRHVDDTGKVNCAPSRGLSREPLCANRTNSTKFESKSRSKQQKSPDLSASSKLSKSTPLLNKEQTREGKESCDASVGEVENMVRALCQNALVECTLGNDDEGTTFQSPRKSCDFAAPLQQNDERETNESGNNDDRHKLHFNDDGASIRKEVDQIRLRRDEIRHAKDQERLQKENDEAFENIRLSVQKEVKQQIADTRRVARLTLDKFDMARREIQDYVQILELHLQELSARQAEFESSVKKAEEKIMLEAENYLESKVAEVGRA